MKQDKNGFAFAALLLIAALVALVLYFVYTGPKKDSKIESSPMASPTSELASPSPVSKDNSIQTIESELDSTVILEEDFSDL